MTADSTSLAFADSSEVREYLVEALKLDLVGPGADHGLADERLRGWVRPSIWYLTGFLIPSDTPFENRSDVDEDDSPDDVSDTAGLVEDANTPAHDAASIDLWRLAFMLAFCMRHDGRWPSRSGCYPPPGTL